MWAPTQEVTRSSGYLPSLDGWRALAIFAVIMSHDLPWITFGHSNALYREFGGEGVNLFFAISGLLITTRILEEERLVGRFDVKRFYIRRFFRIQPAQWVYLSALAILMAIGIIHTHWLYWLAALLMFQNFVYHGATNIVLCFFVAHFWTLAVEEHFYILLSLTLKFIKRHRLTVLVCLMFVFDIGRHIAERKGILLKSGEACRTYWNLPLLLYASAIAAALQRPPVKRFAVKYLRPWVIFPITLLVIGGHLWVNHVLHDHAGHGFPTSGWLGQIDVVARYFFALWVVSTMLHERAWLTCVLEWAPMRWIGKMSYSIYLWHILFFFQLWPGTHITNPVLVALSWRPMKYVAALAMASLSYYFIEKPMIRFGHRLAPPATPGRQEFSDLPVETASGDMPAA